MLVDGVLVVEVAHHPARDRSELGEHAAEQPAVVHLRQPRVQAGARLQELEPRVPAGRIEKEIALGEALRVLLNARERVVGDGGAAVDRRLERREPGVRLVRGRARIDEPDAVAGFHQVGPDRHRRHAADPLQPPGDASGMTEVIAHQPLDARLGQRARIRQHAGRLLLHRVAQHVLVPPALEVQDRPRPQQELFRLVEARGIRRPLLEQRRIGQPGDRPYRRDIAQTARCGFDVGLQLIERGIERRVPFVGQLQQRVDEMRVERRPGETSS